MIAHAFQLYIGFKCHGNKDSDSERFKPYQSIGCMHLDILLQALGTGVSKAVEVCLCDQDLHEVLEVDVFLERLDSIMNHFNSFALIKSSNGLEFEWLIWRDEVSIR